MSIRLSGYGIDIDSILKMFGSKNQDYVNSYKGRIPDRNLPVLEEAVMSGVPFKGLYEEEWPQIIVIKTLFETALDPTWGDVEFHYSSLSDLLSDHLMPEVDMTARDLLAYFIDGRPIFGHKFGGTEAMYGYLTADEVKKLNKSLDRFKLPDPDSDEWDDLPDELIDSEYSEFTGAITELMPRVIAKNQGLAIYIG